MDFNIEIDLLSSKSENSIIFDIHGDFETGLHKSIVNALRRTLLSDIQSIGFRIDMNNKDIHIIQNNTSLHNEFLEHRISLIPLYIDPDNYHKQYLFKLNVNSNSEDTVKMITSEHFDIYPLKNDIDIDELKEQTDIDLSNYDTTSPLSFEEKKKIFRPFETKGKHYFCPITELKSIGENTKQGLELWGVPRISTANENASWQAVSLACYSFKRDADLFKKVLDEKIEIEGIEGIEEKKKYAKSLYLSESERYFHRDKNIEPYWYTFKIDSVHFNNSKELFLKSCQIIIDQIELFKNELPKITTEDDSIISLDVKENIYTLTVFGYNDTIGNILQSYISMNILEESEFNVCGYKRTHPLEEIIQFHLSYEYTKDIVNVQQKTNSLIELFITTCLQLIDIYSSIKFEADKKL